MKYVHVTEDGRKIRLEDLSDLHLANIIKCIERKAAKGFIVRNGGGRDPEEYWYDEEELSGVDALEYLNYSEYVGERERRKGMCDDGEWSVQYGAIILEGKCRENATKRLEKKPKRYSFRAYRINNGVKVPVTEKGLCFVPVEDENGGYLSYFEWCGIEKDKAVAGKHNDAYYRMLEEKLKRTESELLAIKQKLEIHKKFMDELFSNLVGE